MLAFDQVTFRYGAGDFRLRVGELRVEAGAVAAWVGPSGCGKTTCLHLAAGIIRPDAGRVLTLGTDLGALDEVGRRDFRAARVGLVFQEFELLDYLSVWDNLLLPYRMSPALRLAPGVRERAWALSAEVGIDDKLDRRPRELSQGERQRAAVCRALLPEPPLVLADEPTGNLDPENAGRVLGLLLDDARRRGSTLVTVTHDHGLLDRFDAVVDLAAAVGPGPGRGGEGRL